MINWWPTCRLGGNPPPPTPGRVGRGLDGTSRGGRGLGGWGRKRCWAWSCTLSTPCKTKGCGLTSPPPLGCKKSTINLIERRNSHLVFFNNPGGSPSVSTSIMLTCPPASGCPPPCPPPIHPLENTFIPCGRWGKGGVQGGNESCWPAPS